MSRAYDENFFAWNNRGVPKSAQAVSEFLMAALKPLSVLDVGCGQGVWLRAWQQAGVADLRGLDGAYVDRTRLLVDPASFSAVDLAQEFDLEARFDLVQSLEVAEHLPTAASEAFVRSLTRHGDIVLFSAAVVGQGGEHHINEQPLEFWRALFRKNGFVCFDPIRPAMRQRADVQPWYRYNTLLYVRGDAIGHLPVSIAATRVAEATPLSEGGDVSWRVRRAVLKTLPTPVVDYLARQRAKLTHRMTAGAGS